MADTQTPTIDELREIARRLRLDILETTTRAG